MPKQTSKTQSTSTAQYGQIHPESNKYIDAYEQYRPQVDPTIGYGAAAARNRLNASYSNPLGGYATPQIQQAQMNAGNRLIDQDAAQAFRAGQYDVNQQRGGQLGSLAALMSPRVVQTGSTGTSNTEVGKNAWGNILDLGMGAASAALM